MKAVEIEINGQHNECLSFRPLPGKTIRGRFDFARMAEPMAKLMTAEWPMPIPGQRLGIDADGVGYITEPLHDDEYAPIAERIAKAGMKLAPKVEIFENIEVNSWAYWMSRAIDSGVAGLVKGQLPAIDASKARRNFITAEQPPEAIDKLTLALEKQSALFEKLLERLGEQ